MLYQCLLLLNYFVFEYVKQMFSQSIHLTHELISLIQITIAYTFLFGAVEVFSLLKQRVIFKWEEDHLDGKPDNVLLSKWLPQQDILAHPKLRLFVSHGGQSSGQESLCYQKPMVKLFKFLLGLLHS